jgi:hypothetical protein
MTSAINPVFSTADGEVLIALDSIILITAASRDDSKVFLVGGTSVIVFGSDAKLLKKVWSARLESLARNHDWSVRAMTHIEIELSLMIRGVVDYQKGVAEQLAVLSEAVRGLQNAEK